MEKHQADSNQRIQKLEESNDNLTKRVEENNKLVSSVWTRSGSSREASAGTQGHRRGDEEHSLRAGNIVAQRQDVQESALRRGDQAKHRILELQDKKLEKNLKNLGDTISHTGSDLKESLDALDQLDI